MKMLKKPLHTIMYKNNSRNSNIFKGCSPLQLSCILTEKYHKAGYYSYTNSYTSMISI